MNSETSKYQRQFDKDSFAKHNEIHLVEAAPGYAKASMAIQDFHLNSLGVLHGGTYFIQADFSFAMVSNAHAGLPFPSMPKYLFPRPFNRGCSLILLRRFH